MISSCSSSLTTQQVNIYARRKGFAHCEDELQQRGREGAAGASSLCKIDQFLFFFNNATSQYIRLPKGLAHCEDELQQRGSLGAAAASYGKTDEDEDEGEI
jgi:hypothetical protein